MTADRAVWTLHLDPTLCEGHGFCAELLPELLGLDEWGYPIVHVGGLRTAVPEPLIGEARRAVRACPVGALRLLSQP